MQFFTNFLLFLALEALKKIDLQFAFSYLIKIHENCWLLNICLLQFELVSNPLTNHLRFDEVYYDCA